MRPEDLAELVSELSPAEQSAVRKFIIQGGLYCSVDLRDRRRRPDTKLVQITFCQTLKSGMHLPCSPKGNTWTLAFN